MDKYPGMRNQGTDPVTPPNEQMSLKEQIAAAQGVRRHSMPSSLMGVDGSAAYRNQQYYNKAAPSLDGIPEADMASFYPSADAAAFVPSHPQSTRSLKEPTSAAQWYFGAQAAPNLIPQHQAMRQYSVPPATPQPAQRYPFSGPQRATTPMMNTPFYEHAGASFLFFECF
jgi:hypothetical protein